MDDRDDAGLPAPAADDSVRDARTPRSTPSNDSRADGAEPFDSAESVTPMSLAALDRTSPTPDPARAPAVPNSPDVPRTPAAPTPAAPGGARVRAVPEGTEARGFVLYVGLDEAKAAAAGIDLGRLVNELKRVTAELAPQSQTHAAVALAPAGAGGRDVDVVRLALQDPAALARYRRGPEPAEKTVEGVVIDISRKRVLLDGETAALTYKEFELLQYLVLREGKTIERAQLIAALWADAAEGEDVPNERTIDVHVRRLRSKLGGYEDIVRTVRGAGYRFDRHADVVIRYASTPSPDFF
jgi:DNA-binding winged helix-turn-helix (wHTH) protein